MNVRDATLPDFITCFLSQPILQIFIHLIHLPKGANWIFMRLPLPSQVCLIPWYSVPRVLFANAPYAFTHLLLMHIKMVITGLIICGGGKKERSSGLQSGSAEAGGKQQIAVLKQYLTNQSCFTYVELLRGQQCEKIHLHNGFLMNDKRFWMTAFNE